MPNDKLAEIAYFKPKTRIIGKHIIYLPVTSSTNEAAKTVAKNGAEEGTIVVAGRQTAGRGRLDRSWISPEGVLALSVILRPAAVKLPKLIMVASLAAAHTIQNVTGLTAGIKWPNDIQISGKKICGILIENRWSGNLLDYSIVGIGINVNINVSEYSDISGIATSISGESGRDISTLEVAKYLVFEMDKYYAADDVFPEWRDKLINLGTAVSVTSGNNKIHGIAESVGEDGSLCIRQGDGTLTRVDTGDLQEGQS